MVPADYVTGHAAVAVQKFYRRWMVGEPVSSFAQAVAGAWVREWDCWAAGWCWGPEMGGWV